MVCAIVEGVDDIVKLSLDALPIKLSTDPPCVVNVVDVEGADATVNCP